jgi:N-acetylneuraminic acid mutarotase
MKKSKDYFFNKKVLCATTDKNHGRLPGTGQYEYGAPHYTIKHVPGNCCSGIPT